MAGPTRWKTSGTDRNEHLNLSRTPYFIQMTNYRLTYPLIFLLLLGFMPLAFAQQKADSRLLTLERIHSDEFAKEEVPKIQWIDNGDAYVISEKSSSLEGADELVRYESGSQERSLFISAEALQVPGGSLVVESFSLSPDASRVLIFTNSSRVWRSNTKGDYWVYNLNSNQLQRIGRSFEPSSLMFALSLIHISEPTRH